MTNPTPHIHDLQPPVKHEDGRNYVILCTECDWRVKISLEQYLWGNYKEE
jgi:hypothetical protein